MRDRRIGPFRMTTRQKSHPFHDLTRSAAIAAPDGESNSPSAV